MANGYKIDGVDIATVAEPVYDGRLTLVNDFSSAYKSLTVSQAGLFVRAASGVSYPYGEDAFSVDVATYYKVAGTGVDNIAKRGYRPRMNGAALTSFSTHGTYAITRTNDTTVRITKTGMTTEYLTTWQDNYAPHALFFLIVGAGGSGGTGDTGHNGDNGAVGDVGDAGLLIEITN